MKKSSILLTTALCGSFLFLGCTNTTPTANISKSLEHNLTVLTNTINRLDTIDNSYLSNPDIYPITTIGRIVTMFSSAFGIAIIALPSGVITAGYLEEVSKDR